MSKPLRRPDRFTDRRWIMKKLFLMAALGASITVFGGSAMAQGFGGRYYQRQDLREDYRDIRHDHARIERLRADLARDEANYYDARRRGDWRRAQAIRGDMY